MWQCLGYLDESYHLTNIFSAWEQSFRALVIWLRSCGIWDSTFCSAKNWSSADVVNVWQLTYNIDYYYKLTIIIYSYQWLLLWNCEPVYNKNGKKCRKSNGKVAISRGVNETTHSDPYH
jgi:hypothetical protein